MGMQIEHERGMPLGWFDALPREDRLRLLGHWWAMRKHNGG